MKNKIFYAILLMILLLPNLVSAQTTEFTYQGKLTDTTGNAANYDFQFRLCADATNCTGAALLGTLTKLGVPVSSGAFTVQLDFPATSFNGNNRYLETGVKSAGSANEYTTLTPRQQIKSAPYSIRSLNAGNAETAANSTRLGGVTANQYVQTNDSRLSDARNPLSGSGNYIQNNSTLASQPASFNITGSGIIQSDALVGGNLSVNENASAKIFNAATQFNLGGNRVLSVAGTNNTFAGRQTGTVNAGTDNSFFGFNAGNDNTSGDDNSFFGSDAGGVNTSGSNNSFFGSDTGDSNTSGAGNSFFGRLAGQTNTTGALNSYFGFNAGHQSNGSTNAFFGAYAGSGYVSGSGNAVFGYSAGNGENTGGAYNSLFGSDAGSGLFGSGNVAIGHWAGKSKTGDRNIFIGYQLSASDSSVAESTIIGSQSSAGDNSGHVTLIGALTSSAAGVSYGTAIGAGARVSGNNRIVLGRDSQVDTVVVPGKLVAFDGIEVNSLGAAGLTQLCRNSSNQISTCFSSVNSVDVNFREVVNKQQQQIEAQQKQLQQQQLMIDDLRKLVCSQNPRTAVCMESQK